MRITELTEQQMNKDRINVFIDGRFEFGLHIEVLVKYKIKKGMEVSEEQIAQFKSADAFHQAYDKSLNFLSRRPRSSQEVKHYLRDKLIYHHPDYPTITDPNQREVFTISQQEIIEQIIGKLQELGYIDDIAFAKWWITNRREFKPRGKRLLLLELKAKGLSNTDIHTALTTPSEEGHFSSERTEYSEEEAASSLARKYYQKYRMLPTDQQRQKLSRYLAGKGFEWDVVNQVVKNILEDEQ